MSAVSSNSIVELLIKHLPYKMKRLVFLTSFASILKNTTTLDDAILQKLDLLLKETITNKNSMSLPIILSNVIWANKEVISSQLDCLRNNSKDKEGSSKCIKYIVDSMPQWFRYDNSQAMQTDLSTLVVSN